MRNRPPLLPAEDFDFRFELVVLRSIDNKAEFSSLLKGLEYTVGIAVWNSELIRPVAEEN